MKLKITILLYLITIPLIIFPCSAVNKTVDGRTLFGGNMDWINPYTQIKIEPGKDGKNGVIYLGYGERELIAFSGGVNEKGLALDFFSTPPKEVKKSIFRKEFQGKLYKKILQECATVNEALKIVKKYERSYLFNGQMMLVDKTGDSVIVEANKIVKKDKNYQIVTNFNLSDVQNEKYPCVRYNKALNIINKVDFSVEGFEEILDEVKQNYYARFPTVYSYIIDFDSNNLHIYNFGDFTNKYTLAIDEVMSEGYKIIDIPKVLKNDNYVDYLNKYQSQKPKEITIVGIDDFPGVYKFLGGFTFNIIKEQSGLYVIDEDVKYKMIPYDKDKFFFEFLDLKVDFNRNSSNKVDQFTTYHKGWGVSKGEKI